MTEGEELVSLKSLHHLQTKLNKNIRIDQSELLTAICVRWQVQKLTLRMMKTMN